MARLSPPARLRLVEPASTPAASAAPEASLAPQIDDSELLNAVRSGDDWAASAFCRRVRPRIEMTIHRLLGRRDNDVNDLVQVSLLEMVQTIDRFRGECSLDTWTGTVTAHAVFKHIRRRRLERKTFEHDEPADEQAASAEMGAQLVSRDLLQRVRGHLAGMDEDRAWAFLLHDVCGFDLREASRIMDVSVAAAQKRLVRGRHELRARLAEDPELAEMLVEAEGTRDAAPR
jgi:RNA polymerase sigma-70 factor (ECF subfamily)